MNTSQQLIRAVTLLASLGFSACGPLCLGAETKQQKYETSQTCAGAVEAPAALGLSTTPSASCYAGLLQTCVGISPGCLLTPSTCPIACLPIEVVKPNSSTGVAVAINLNPPFVGERMFAANDPGLTIQAIFVGVFQTVANPGEPLTVTSGSVRVRMVPNDVTATVSLDLVTAAGAPIALKNIAFHASGQSVDYCQTN
jgi:hypothetical protein